MTLKQLYTVSVFEKTEESMKGGTWKIQKCPKSTSRDKENVWDEKSCIQLRAD